MGKYCCFLCPRKDYENKSLDDQCPICGRPYGFPLNQRPVAIREYRVVEPRGRGFYAVTYLCHRGRLNKPYILKLSPKTLYSFFGKDFEEECRIHMEVAQDTEHIVPIDDYFDELVQFGDVEIKCHVAVIQFVEGESLEAYVEQTGNLRARSVAQIAIDLFRIWREFINKLRYHNDLHSDNIIIQKLREGARRAESLDETIRAVAIDLGSVADASKSDTSELRLGDQHWLCRHLQHMVDKLRESRRDIEQIDDLDNRIIEALEQITYFLLPAANAGRIPSADQLIKIVRDNFSRGPSPWRERLKLERFDDSYNAIALEPWYVPFLLVDPDDLWIRRISAAGPLLITGMRGCGKTMLLRALDFHARAAPRNGESTENILDRVRNDNYLGLFVPCLNLLIMPGLPDAPASLERLFYAYGVEAIRAVRHLQELDRSTVVPRYFDYIAEAVELNIEATKVPGFQSDDELERFLLKAVASLKKGSSQHMLRTSAADAFGSLAAAIRRCSPLWTAARIFFLLDDVSTRYLRQDMIENLFSALLFQSTQCAFKLTTEAQTLEMGLTSPGGVEKARAGRDYDVFDLGADVYEKTKIRKGNKLFVEQILAKRAQYYPNHPKATPQELLGDCTLEDIALRIATTNANSRERKAVYAGISALSALCVGDIGDVISLYELILRKAAGQTYPVKSEIQSECYQAFCSRRLYDLNRRESDLKDFALTFAEASYELLVRSNRGRIDGKLKRLRQYVSIYVRVTAGDTRKQFERLRELIDAGVFVLHGGTPRTKTRDADPIQQFKLTYRKLFGLSNFIGLAERDRFELSGEQLEEWLSVPARGKEVLLRNLGKGSDEGGDFPEMDSAEPEAESQEQVLEKVIVGQQERLFDVPASAVGEVFSNGKELLNYSPKMRTERLSIEEIAPERLQDYGIQTVLLGLGFEERSVESAKRIMSLIRPHEVILIEYKEPGRTAQIKDIVSQDIEHVSTVKYEDILAKGVQLPKTSSLIDVTGLAKPALFSSIRDALHGQGKVWVCHTGAEEYYPLDVDIARVLAAEENRDQYALLNSLSEIFTGEKGPYAIDGLLESDPDESRRKVLCAFASAKHQRLLSILDMRQYDRIEIVVPPVGTLRSKIARIAAEIATWNFRASGTTEIGSNDLHTVVDFLFQQYIYWYVDRGYNMELALTGSKIQAIACAAVSVVCKMAQCWYVRPEELDPKRFTKGIGDSQYYMISKASR